MKRQLGGSQKGKPYGQRAASECVNSMIKRNLGDHLRAKTPHRRQLEQLLRTLTHNLMIIRRQRGGLRQSRTGPIISATLK